MVAFEEVMADSVCVVNSCLVLLLLALVDGRLPSTLAAVKRLLRDAEVRRRPPAASIAKGVPARDASRRQTEDAQKHKLPLRARR